MSITEVIESLRPISDNVAVQAGEIYGQTIDNAVHALRLLKVQTEDLIAERDRRIHELELQSQEQQRERDEAVHILETRIRQLERRTQG